MTVLGAMTRVGSYLFVEAGVYMDHPEPNRSAAPKPKGKPETEIKLCNLPPFPGAASRLLQTASRDDVEFRDIAAILKSDPSLAAEVLRIANSPIFAFRTEIASIDRAVSLLGLDRIRELALAIALKSYGTLKQPAHKLCWSHSIACGVLAEELAPAYGLRASEALTAGLLHDVGRIGLLKAYAAEYAPLMMANYEGIAQQLTAERWMLGMDHCVSGAFLAKTWAFPPRLHDAVEQHHAKIDDDDDESVLGLIKVCCLLAGTFGYPEIKSAEEPLRTAILKSMPFAARTRITEKEAAIKIHIGDRLKFLQG